MGFFGFQSLKSLIACMLVGVLLSCSKEQSRHEGTESTGGGSAAYSTAAQVEKALDLAIKLATEPNHRINVFVQFFMDKGRISPTSFIRKPDHLFPSLGDINSDAELGDITDGTRFTSPFLEALSKNKLERRSSGDCLTTVQGEHKDASVSQLSLNADICVGIGNLTRIPPSSLLREILSLLLHETVHMAGAGESEAKVWQQEFSEYFGLRFGDAISDTVTGETLRALGAAKILLKRANDLASTNSSDSKIYGVMGRAAQIMIGLPDLLDPLALNLKMKTSKPELYGNYANSVLAFIVEAQVKFQFPPLKPAFIAPVSDMPAGGAPPAIVPDQIQITLGKLNELFYRVNENFLAFTGAEGAESVCVIPGPRLNKDNFNRAVHKPVFPKVNCNPSGQLEFKPINVQTPSSFFW